MIIRIFDTAIDPGDIERAKELFRETVRPAFEGFPGCQGIEMFIGVEDHSGDLAEVAAVSRWDSLDDIGKAIHSDDYDDALGELRKLFVQAPLVRHFERVD
jgi:heme-degrading monooxygenase HmoA